MKKFSSPVFGMALTGILLSSMVSAAAETNVEKLSRMPATCNQRMILMLQDEVNLYRGVQYGPSDRAVLQTVRGSTSDLVPYLTENYHALSCRLQMVCDAVGSAQEYAGNINFIQRPLGCSRLLAARGRWWSRERRDQTFRMEPVAECEYPAYADSSYNLLPSAFGTEAACDGHVEQILAEERQMLRLVVAQDSAERGTRRVVPVFQRALADIRSSFLLPLRSIADLFGSVIHPIPCLLTQCN